MPDIVDPAPGSANPGRSRRGASEKPRVRRCEAAPESVRDPDVALDAVPSNGVMNLNRALRGRRLQWQAPQHSPAERLLGRDHPFVAADGELRSACRTLIVTALFVGALAAFTFPERSAPVAVAGATVLIWLTLRLLILADARADQAMALVLEGGEALPIPAVARVRRSLLGHRRDHTARALMRTLECATAQAERHPADELQPILSVAGEVAEVARLLQRTESARAVAMADRLVATSAGWYMLAFERGPLARELGRIRFLLLADEAGRGDRRGAQHC
jgi:hypothetical protein